jgi:hypothetical protein
MAINHSKKNANAGGDSLKGGYALGLRTVATDHSEMDAGRGPEADAECQ